MDILEINKIRKEYGTLVAVNDISLSVEKGQVLGLIGPNGAGKTTLLRILATILRPTNGNVRLLGYDLAKEYLAIRKHIGFLPDFFGLYNDLTLRECLEFFAKAYKVENTIIPKRVDEVLDYIELQDKRDDFIRNLSRGMVQRMGVGVLLVHNPNVFLLDEPASGLDPKARIQLRAVLKRLSSEGKTIIISSHILTELSGFCTHIALMNKGNVVLHGAVDDIQKQVFGSKKICISVLDNCDQAVEIIKEFPDTKIEIVKDNNITLEIKAEESELASLNSKLVTQGVKVFNFCEEKKDLEDLFMKISTDG
ncbi:MAG: ABC transporter ATP-binding protein [Planctomycetes bacterium]|nr:ABC transporter ATP-binding protein [Planctomycetota bacterium]